MTKTQDDLITDWVAALRSGKYKQTKNWLHDDEGFCCLGVLCEVMGLEKRYDEKSGCYYYGMNCTRTVPSSVMKVMQLSTSAGHFNSPAGDTSLAIMNDTGSTFDEIADTIESRPEGLFR